MIVVNAHVCEQAGFFRRRVVFRTIGNVRHHGRFKIDIQRKFKHASFVALFGVRAVIDIRGKRYDIFRIVFQVVFQRAKIDFDVRTVNRTAAVIRFAYVILCVNVNRAPRRRFFDYDIHLFRVAEKPCRYRTDFVDRAVLPFLIGKGDMFLVRRDGGGGRILRKRVRAQRGNIIGVQSADDARGIGVRHQFIFRVQPGVQFVFVGIVVFFVEYGRLRPVAVKRQHGNVQRNACSALRVEFYKPFHVHAVFERIVQILFIFLRKRDTQSNFCALPRLHRNRIAALRSAGNACHLRLRAGKQIAVLRYGGIAVTGIRRTYALRHHHGIYVVRNGVPADVVYGKRHLVHARSVFIVAQFQFGFIRLVAGGVEGRDIRSRRRGFRYVHQPRALLSYGVRQPVFVKDNIRRRHHQLIHAFRHFRGGQRIVAEHAAVTHVLADQRRSARLIGRRHRRTGHSFVFLPRNGG